jgi:hypothetical protein
MAAGATAGAAGQPVGNLVRAPAGNPRLHLNAGYLTFSPSATVISHRRRLFKKLHSLLSSIRRIIQTRGHSCARTSRPSCRLGRGLTRSDRFYTPTLIRPTSGSDGSCHSLFDGPSEQLSSRCVRLMGRWVNRRPESKSRPLLARRGLSPATVPTASSTARSRRRGTSTMTRSDRRSCSRQRTFDCRDALRPI